MPSAAHPIPVLGIEVIDNGESLRYPSKPVDSILNKSLDSPLTSSGSLGLLGTLLQEPDFFDFHIIPAKNLLVGLISKARAVLDHTWSTPIPTDVQTLIRAWVDYLREHPPQAIPRRIHTDHALDIYVDASKTMVAYEVRQFDRPILRGQLTLTKSQRNLHINALELLGIYYALARIRLLEFDTRMQFNDVRVYCDSLTAVAIARDRRVPGGLHEALTRKYLELIIGVSGTRQVTYTHISGHANYADSGTRSTLVDDILSVREKYNSVDNKQATPDLTAFPVRKRADAFDDDSIGRRVRLRHSAARPVPSEPPTYQAHGQTLPASRSTDDLPPSVQPSPTSSLAPTTSKTTDDLPCTRLIDYAFKRLPDELLRRLEDLPLLDGFKQVVDADLQQILVDLYHSTYHEGIYATYARIKKLYSWPNMLDKISATTKSCLSCAKLLTHAGDLSWKQRPSPQALPSTPFTHLALDVHGPYFNTYYVLTCTCKLTTYLICRALPTAPLASDVIDLLNNITCVYGIVPTAIRTDNGTIFHKAASQLTHVSWEFTPTYASASNGQIERKHRDLARFLRLGFLQAAPPVVTCPDPHYWTHLVQVATMRVNLLVIPSAHSLCARDLVYNFPAHDLVSLTCYPPVPDKETIWRQHRQQALDRSLSQIPVSRRQIPLQPGMPILLREYQPRKDQPRWSDPIEIKELLGDNRLLLTDGRHVHSKNVKLLPRTNDEFNDDDDFFTDDE
ncbi:gag/pol/env polyprotein, putative [Perkinsus marinus ATCC 50983]|uniref:Gag/pol/env polyprotein, putative n=1 Tax=Perkinsus marinus (strain ATCC 50983 / TXsc) TaxID=423536 RepID=C5L0Q6_PERM5|nr:gag/pol/env polyprotein, putative [Perkinsus marinus ATCC 50983]EER09708.1 gag/pol/env polyprotein, putative [Perkinsus marinus ATCC 50983]|eukprot:XP_002777913.1 gag/pol/env polyprotein, putative [Perkinsus marinus ATCC 50983]